MKTGRRLAIFGWTLCIGALVASSIGLFSLASFVKQAGDEAGLQGDVGLRNYYQKGSGAPLDPFVISRPIHLYNLSRLQALGLYSDPSSPKYFQLGYDPDGSGVLRFYENDTSSTMINYLNMSAYDGSTENKTIHPIGSEAFPFCGRFDGKNLQISNLKVIGDPQDVGVFGYSYSGSKISNVLFDNLTVVCRGYDTADFGDLFSSNISPNITIGGVEVPSLSTVDVVSGNRLEVSFIEPVSQYTTEIAASSEYFKCSTDRKKLTIVPAGTLDSDSHTISIFDLFSSYMGSYPVSIHDRISVIAHKIVSGVPTARVVSVYNVTFSKNSENAAIKMSVEKTNQEDHGCNVGFIVGHCDGSLANAYVHNGTMDINPSVQGRTTLAQKSEYGLIGLIGSSVNNGYKGTAGTAGVEGTDIGVVDFSAIYKDIIDSNANFHQEAAGVYTYTPRQGTAYEDYLRYKDESDSYRWTYAPNTVSLRGRSVIQDSLEDDYGLGVFAVATDTTTDGNGATYYNENLGQCMIEKGSEINEIYYTTAEWKNTSLETSSNWGETQTGNKMVHPGYFIPDEYDNGSGSHYEKNVNYIFRTELDGDSSRFYFADADTSTKGGNFLKEYFHSKLVDSDSNPISKTSANCGVMVKDVDGDNIASFTASLHLPNSSNDGNSNLHYMVSPTDAEKTLISRTVNFTIKADWANVTVIARKASGGNNKGAQVGIYRVSDITPGASLLTDRAYDRPDYAMYIPSDSDFAYFDFEDGVVGNSTSGSFAQSRYANVDHSTNSTVGKLFAHTFCLPKGDYAIATSSNDCYLHYVCAQGQDAGDFNTAGTLHSVINTIEFVDFLKTPMYKEQDGNLVKVFDFAHPEDKRCFLALDQTHVSHFKTGHLVLTFDYNETDGHYYIQVGTSGQESQITTISTVNYAKFKLTIHLINQVSRDESITYPAT